MLWIIQHEGTKAAVKKAVDDFYLGPTPAEQPPEKGEAGRRPPKSPGDLKPGTAINLDQDPVPPTKEETQTIDVVKTAVLALIDKLPKGANGVFVYVAGDGAVVTTFRVEGRALTV